ncbi:PepSY domain-containing protein [Flavobacterium hibisci]|uniref:PepSY domain-containing protein n=1 Tax=Flavobacterium hibisci TaxID=1914462 RepID=UPI001CBBDEDF|nr:PepSY domain-containing protein [Flavobacterium hibisci]
MWLGLISGAIVFVVCLTACIWVFNEEITGLIDSKSNIKPEQKEVVIPSKILEIAAKRFPGKKIESAIFKEGRTVDVGIGEWEDKERYTLNGILIMVKLLMLKHITKTNLSFLTGY